MWPINYNNIRIWNLLILQAAKALRANGAQDGDIKIQSIKRTGPRCHSHSAAYSKGVHALIFYNSLVIFFYFFRLQRKLFFQLFVYFASRVSCISLYRSSPLKIK